MRAARRSGRDGRRRGAHLRTGRRAPGGIRDGNGQDPRLPRSGDPNRERVLISTGTKNLQEQIFFKDIPALRDALGIPFTATYMKGRANYLCLHKLDRLNEGVGMAVNDVFLPIVREWAIRTETGDRAELEDLPEAGGSWSEVC